MANKPIPDQHLKRLENISIFLKELRFNTGMTQKELSQEMNLHRNTIIRAENANNLTLISIFELADAHGISVSELFLDIK